MTRTSKPKASSPSDKATPTSKVKPKMPVASYSRSLTSISRSGYKRILPQPRDLRDKFLSGLALVYLFQFMSIYLQAPGLFGKDGILPVNGILQPAPDSLSGFLEQPSLLRFHEKFGLSIDAALDVLCLTGILLASLTFWSRSFQMSFIFLCLWFINLSLHHVGQTFLWFQWDILLLEAGLISVFLAPMGVFWIFKLPTFPHMSISFFLIRWLLFRLMFASGAIKLISQCPTWWSLTALHHHFQSQCLATPLAWYAHQLPGWILKLGVVSTYVIEIASPLFFFIPLLSVQKLNVFLQVSWWE